MMNMLCGILSTFTFITDNLLYILLGLLLLVVIFFLLKYESTRRITLYLLSAIIISVGVICTINSVKMFDISSQEFGTSIHIETKEEYNVISTFDYGYIEFDTTDYSNYINTTSFPIQKFNGIDQDYIILFNNQPASNIELTAGKISGVLTLRFYDTNNNITSSATLNIVVEYLNKETRVTTTIVNSNSSLSFLNSYMELNGTIIQVVERI